MSRITVFTARKVITMDPGRPAPSIQAPSPAGSTLAWCNAQKTWVRVDFFRPGMSSRGCEHDSGRTETNCCHYFCKGNDWSGCHGELLPFPYSALRKMNPVKSRL